LALAACLDAVEILKSLQILDLIELTFVPSSPMLVKGVLEVDGRSIPLMDLRIKLEAPGPCRTDAAAAIIVQVGEAEVGLIVDTAPEA